MKPIFEADKEEVYYEDDDDEDFDVLDDGEIYCPVCGCNIGLFYEECPICNCIL